MFKLTTFKGEAPLIDENLLGNEQSTFAQNVDFTKELLAPVLTNIVTAGAFPINTKSIFPYTDAILLDWQTPVDVVRSQIAQDDYDRIYITGDGAPKVMSNDSHPAYYDLGVPAPESAVAIGTITVIADTDPEDLTNDTTRFYIETFVTRFGEEGSNSPVSDEVELTNQYCTVELLLNTLPLNTNNVTKRRIYRSATTDATSGYFFVAELPLATTTFTDDLLDKDLGPELSTSEYDMPPADLKGLTAHPAGFVAGFVGNELYMSESYLPYAFPSLNRHSLEYDIVAIANSADTIVVATTGAPYMIVGARPDSTSAIKLELQEACVSARSMVDMGKYAVYASRNGLVAVNGNSATLITETILDRSEWAAFKPDTIRAYAFDNLYIGFYDGGGFVFEPLTGNFSRINGEFDGGYFNIETGELLLVNDYDLENFRQGGAFTQLTWISKLFSVPAGSAFSAMWIECDDITKVGFECLIDGVTAFDYAIGSITNERFRVPMVRGGDIQFEITSTTKIRRITFGQNMGELK